jgi:hypothetical protein
LNTLSRLLLHVVAELVRLNLQCTFGFALYIIGPYRFQNVVMSSLIPPSMEMSFTFEELDWIFFLFTTSLTPTKKGKFLAISMGYKGHR